MLCIRINKAIAILKVTERSDKKHGIGRHILGAKEGDKSIKSFCLPPATDICCVGLQPSMSEKKCLLFL